MGQQANSEYIQNISILVSNSVKAHSVLEMENELITQFCWLHNVEIVGIWYSHL